MQPRGSFRVRFWTLASDQCNPQVPAIFLPISILICEPGWLSECSDWAMG